MPACARKEIVRQGQPGIFHVSSRVVRRAFLLGRDPLTSHDYNHRRHWVLQRLQLLVANFAIDVCFLAVLANHLHLVLRTTPRLVQRWGSWEVARRWLRLYPGRRLLDGSSVEPIGPIGGWRHSLLERTDPWSIIRTGAMGGALPRR